MQVEVRPVYVFESKLAVATEFQTHVDWRNYGFFESGCQVRTQREWKFQGKTYSTDEYILSSVWTDGRAKIRHPVHGELGPIGLRVLLEAGFERI